MPKIQIKTEEVTIYKPVPAKWSRVLLWLVSFGKRGETFVIDVIPGKKYITTPDHRVNYRVNWRGVMPPPDHFNSGCPMPPTVPPKDSVDIVDEVFRVNNVNCRCAMPRTVPPKDFVDLVDAQRRRNTP